MPKKDGQSNTSDNTSTRKASGGANLPPRNFHFSSGDLLLVMGILVFCGILITGVLLRTRALASREPYVRITVDGDVVLNRKMSAFTEETEYQITTGEGHVVVFLSSDVVYIQSSDCPDQICVREGELKKPGDGAICLPNKVVVEVVAGPEGTEETEGKVDAVAK